MKLARHILSVTVFVFVALSFVFLAERGMSATDKTQPAMERLHPVSKQEHGIGGPLMIALPQEVRAPNVSSEVYFCEERMPLEFTDIHERFDQELLRNTYWHSSTLLIALLSARRFRVYSAFVRVATIECVCVSVRPLRCVGKAAAVQNKIADRHYTKPYILTIFLFFD